MTENWRLEVKTPDGQNVLEYHDLSASELNHYMSKVVDLIGGSDWNYIDFELSKEEDSEGGRS